MEATSSTACSNCGTPVSDRFCPHCGQRATERIVSLRALLRDVAEDQLSLEARLPRTLGALLFQPGRLTADYRDGRVARYIPPTRIYLLAGLIFFLAVNMVVSYDALFDNIADYVDPETGRPMEGADIVIVGVPLDPERVPRPLQPAAAHYHRQQERLNALPVGEGARIVYGGILGNVSIAVLLLVPAFALLLKALYPRRYYTEHVIFILHLHSALFLIGLVPLFATTSWVTVIALAVMAAYAYLALRRCYGSSALATVPRLLALLLLYPVAVVLVSVGVLMVTVLTY